MNLSVIFEKSLLLQNWQIIIVPLLIVILVKCILNKLLKASNDKRTVEKPTEPLDGEEYIGANFNDADDDNKHTNENDVTSYAPSLEVNEHIPYIGASVTLPDGAQQFYEMVNNRRSVRNYRTTPIPIAVIEHCIRAAGTAPSGAHTEPWSFCVIGDANVKQQIRDIIESEEELNYAQRMHRQWTADLRPLRTTHIKPYLTDAPYLILVFKQVYGLSADGKKRRQHYYNEISVAISVGILLCALQAAGLSSLVTTPLNCGPALRSLLGRPKNEKLLVLLPVGYPAEDCQVPDLKRKDLINIMNKY